MKKNVRFTQNGIYLEGSQSEKEGKEIPTEKIGDKVYGNLNEDRIRKILKELRENAQ